jgi:trimeric autotransporter adhesin
VFLFNIPGHMNELIPIKRGSQSIVYLTKRSSCSRGFVLIALTLGCLALSLVAQAAPDGDVGHGSTAEGTGALSSQTSGSFNTALGLQALFSTTTGTYNTGTGVNALFSNTGGAYNTANGLDALYSNTSGISNTATGVNALLSNTTASYNTADGVNALYSNTTGTYNTATGQNVLYSNTTGAGNTANGDYALLTNTTGSFNTAIGLGGLYSNTTGYGNTASGVDALFSSTTGRLNTADGLYALFNNTTGFFNTANGAGALYHNTTGNNNTADGVNALVSNTTGINNTADGNEALSSNTTGSNNIVLGSFAGSNLTTGNNNIDIGNQGVAAEANTIRIGTVGTHSATFIAGISGATASGGAAVFVNSNGQLGTATSSRRFKQEIKPMDKASEAILALRPVTFRYKQEIDPKGIPQFGLVAEEVEQVNPDLVVRDAEGKVYTVRYEAVNAMLLNEFLKEHSQVEQLEATVSENSKQIKTLAASSKGQASQIQKLNAQFATVSPRRVTHVVDNNQ